MPFHHKNYHIGWTRRDGCTFGAAQFPYQEKLHVDQRAMVNIIADTDFEGEGDVDRNDFVQNLIERLTSEPAIFVYSWVALVAGFIASMWIAYRLTGVVRQINAAEIFNGQDIPEYKIRKPILNRIDKLQKNANSGLASIFVRAGAMILFGVVIPGVLLGTIVHFQTDLLPGPPILVSGSEALAPSAVGYLQTVGFVFDQALRGGLSDTMEVFDLAITPIRNNPDQGLYAVLLVVYRFVCGTVVTAMLYVSWRTYRGTRALNRALENLRHQLKKFDQPSPVA